MTKQKAEGRPRRAVSQGEWLTIGEAAEYLGMSTRYVEKRKVDGTLPFHKFGAAIRFHKKDLDEHIAKSRRVGR